MTAVSLNFSKGAFTPTPSCRNPQTLQFDPNQNERGETSPGPWSEPNRRTFKRGALSQDQAGSRLGKHYFERFSPSMTRLLRKDKGQLLSKQNELGKHIKMPRFFSCFSWRGIRVMRQQYGRTVPPETKDNAADKQAVKQAIFNALMSDANKPINVKYRDMRLMRPPMRPVVYRREPWTGFIGVKLP